jgi:hypothetical protein
MILSRAAGEDLPSVPTIPAEHKKKINIAATYFEEHWIINVP